MQEIMHIRDDVKKRTTLCGKRSLRMSEGNAVCFLSQFESFETHPNICPKCRAKIPAKNETPH